jgi:iron transport multicopper oxidase
VSIVSAATNQQPGLGAPNTIFAGGINSAILRYGTASDDDPTTSDTSGLNPMVEWKLVPYFSPAAPGPADINSAQVHKVTLNFTLDTTKYRYALNGVDTTLPYIPVLSQILQGATASQLVPTHQYVSLPANSVIQLTIPGGGPAPDTHHPIHLHGHNFSVIRAAGQSTYNFVNPPRRDVVNMGTASDQVTIRFTTGNDGLSSASCNCVVPTDDVFGPSGPWFMYDHNAFHMNAGFGTVLSVMPWYSTLLLYD